MCLRRQVRATLRSCSGCSCRRDKRFQSSASITRTEQLLSSRHVHQQLVLSEATSYQGTTVIMEPSPGGPGDQLRPVSPAKSGSGGVSGSGGGGGGVLHPPTVRDIHVLGPPRRSSSAAAAAASSDDVVEPVDRRTPVESRCQMNGGATSTSSQQFLVRVDSDAEPFMRSAF